MGRLETERKGKMASKRHRRAEVWRKTKETEIHLKIDLDGVGKSSIETSIPFFDHMLTLMGYHGLLDLHLRAKGRIGLDAHHTVEDVDICLGQGIRDALKEAQGIERYGMSLLPMDESLVMVALDLSMRPYLVFDVKFVRRKVGHFDLELVEEFFRALSTHARMTLHIGLLHGRNNHHIVEAVFKGVGRALRQAVSFDERVKGVPSTKGVL